jgi:hypothetical protein
VSGARGTRWLLLVAFDLLGVSMVKKREEQLVRTFLTLQNLQARDWLDGSFSGCFEDVIFARRAEWIKIELEDAPQSSHFCSLAYCSATWNYK